MKKLKSLMSSAVALFANEDAAPDKKTTTPAPAKAPQTAVADATKEANGTEDPGKGKSPDPATGKTFDFRKMLMELLGLSDQATDDDVTQAYNSCMTTEPDEEAKAVKGKLDEAVAGKTEAEGKVAVAEKTAADHAASAHDAITKLHETTQANEELVKRCELAEGAFANERNAHVKTLVDSAVLLGKLTKADGEKKVIELANAKTPAEFEAGVALIANAQTKLGTTSISLAGEGLTRTIAPGTASGKFLTMVNEACATDKKHDFAWHWSNCGKSEAGKALLSSMKQPENQTDKFAPKKA